MIVGIGMDLIEIARFKEPDSAAFIQRCFTLREQTYLRGKGPQTKAGLFAGKEAVVKALGTGFRGFWPCAVEILHGADGKPYVTLHGRAAQLAKKKRVSRITLSITHNETTAAAVATAERTEKYENRFYRANARNRRSRHT